MENRLSRFCDQVIEAGWLVAAVTIPLFFNIFSSRVFEPDKLTLLRSIVMVMAAAWLIRFFTKGGRPAFSPTGILRTSPLAVPALLFAAVYVLATIFSVEPRISIWGSYVRLQGLVTNLAYITLFFLVADRMKSRIQLERLITVIIIGSIPISLYGLIQNAKLDPLPWGGDVTFRVTSTMGNAIFLAAYLIMVTPLTVVRLGRAIRNVLGPDSGKAGLTGRLLVGGYVVVLGMQLVTILFTKSRGPWIGLVAGLFFMALVWFIRSRWLRGVAFASAGFAACVAFVVLLNVPASPLGPLKTVSPYIERLGTVMDLESPTNRVRTLIWFGDKVGRGAAGLITDTPLRTLIGHGPETMYITYGPHYPPDLAHLEARNAAPDRSHNDLLDYLVTMGFLGLFVYLLVMVRGFSVGLRSLWQDSDRLRQVATLGILGALTAHTVEVLTGIAIASTLTYTWLLLGALAAMAVMPAEEAASAASTLASAMPESRGAKRRKAGRKEAVQPNRPAALEMPWYRTRRSYLLLSYLLLTAVGTLMILGTTVGTREANGASLFQFLRDPDPAALVITSYLWLLVGIAVTAIWVKRPGLDKGGPDSRAILLAVAIGVVAVVLPAKLFLSSIVGDMYFKRGLGAATAQRPDLSIGPYLTAIEWSPDEDFYFLYLGQAYLEMARNSPADKPAQRFETLADLARVRERSVAQLGRENLIRAAFLALKRARDLNPLNIDHSANLGRLHRLWGEMSTDNAVRQEKFADSIKYYEVATSLNPNAAHLKAEWGLLYYLSGDFEKAMKQYEAAISLDRQYAPTYAYVADLLRANGDIDGAIAQYEFALSVHDKYGTLASPMDTAVRAGLGEQYFRKGRYRESLREAQKVAQSNPKDFSARKNLALIYRALDDREKAVEEARVALSIAPAEERSALQAFIAELQAPRQ